MRAIGWLVVLAMVGACAKDLADLEPYPCAQDMSCPEGLACVSGKCVVAIVDALGCGSGGVVCPTGTNCYVNACEVACTSDATCGNGRLCAPPPAGTTDSAVCMIDCTTNTSACPEGFSCTPRFTDSSSVCVPGATTLPACLDVASVQSCLAQLCGNNEDFTVPCDTGSSSGNCFFNDVCEPTMPSPCQCPVANTLCNGSTQSSSNPCTLGANNNPQCMCITPEDLAPSCTSNHFQSQGACVCAGNQRIAYSCGDTTTCEQACTASH